MHRSLAALALTCALLTAPLSGQAQTTDPDPGPDPDPEIEDIDFNYVYSTVLGTGFYSTAIERVFILRIPLKWTVAELSEKSSLDLLLPVTVGVRDILDEDGGLEIPDRLMTTSFMPGLAWNYQARDNWQLAPSLQIGGAWDFQDDTRAWMYSLALRSHAWWDLGKHRLGLGNRIVGAGQHIPASRQQQGFILLENGLDWNYQWPWTLAEQPLSTSIFVLWQNFIDDMAVPGISGESTALDNLYQLGFTFGLRETISLWGFMPFSRVGFSFIRGNTVSGGELKALSLNLGFPLSYF